jgi:DNA-binding transcriptional MerR regulator
MDKSADAFRTISEVAEELDLPQHVLRFWETRFPQIKPLKRAGGRRFYRPHDVEILRAIRRLLYGEGYTIKGVQRILKEQGARAVIAPGIASGLAASETGLGPAPEAAPDSSTKDRPAGWTHDLFARLSVPPSDDPNFEIERRDPQVGGRTSGDDAPRMGEAAQDAAAAREEMIRRLREILGALEACERMLEAGRRPKSL